MSILFLKFFYFFRKSLESLENTRFLWHNIIKKIMKERLPERQAEKKLLGVLLFFLQNGKTTETHKRHKKRR